MNVYQARSWLTKSCFISDSGQNSQSSELNDNDLMQMEHDARPESTNRATMYGVKKFQDWLTKRGKTCDFRTISAADLNELLRKYYAEVKSSKPGNSLTPSTLNSLRAAIHRHVTNAPYSRPFNIVKDSDFTSANNIFTARCKLYFKSGNKKPQHKAAIGEGDMQKLTQYFANWKSNPQTLVEATWFFLCFFFGRRGREGWASMTKDTFVVQQDSEGHIYIAATKTEVTKNHPGGHKQTDIDYGDERMYGGVDIYSFYLSKLNPKCNRLFQHPLLRYEAESFWYKN
jgi:hypothetical protein